MENKTLELTCIRCPMGCRLSATVENGAVSSVTGNTCRRGAEYARTEAVSPVRTVTSTVRAASGERSVVAVKTVPEVPKDKVFAVMEVIRTIRVAAPVHIGDVLVRGVAGTDSCLVATAELKKV